MSATPKKQSQTTPAKPRLNLPFQRRERDIGSWSYDHRQGIYITLIAYLIFGIVFVAGKIKISEGGGQGEIVVDFGKEEQKDRELLTPEQIRMMEAHYSDFSDVQNRASNEGAEAGKGQTAGLNASLSDAKGTAAGDIYDSADELGNKMDANRKAYEAGLAREQAIIDAHKKTSDRGTTSQSSADSRAKGRVTVSFSFENPVRTSAQLVVPAYMCEGGGEVVVSVVLDTNGNVTSAAVDRTQSSSDECMHSTALYAARSSRFNLDSSAPSKHKGTISYIFIPQ